MSYTMEDYQRDRALEQVSKLPPEDIIKIYPLDNLLKALSPEDILKGLSKEDFLKLAEKLKSDMKPEEIETVYNNLLKTR